MAIDRNYVTGGKAWAYVFSIPLIWVLISLAYLILTGAKIDGGKMINLTIPVTEPTPDAAAVGAGWSPCTTYRVTLPETMNYAKTNLDMCVTPNAAAA